MPGEHPLVARIAELNKGRPRKMGTLIFGTNFPSEALEISVPSDLVRAFNDAVARHPELRFRRVALNEPNASFVIEPSTFGHRHFITIALDYFQELRATLFE